MKAKGSLFDDVVGEIAGNDGLKVVNYLKNKKNISEFKIAGSLKKDVNDIRHSLYKLHNVSLVSFTRKKDKKKGWYIYYWTFDNKRLSYLAQRMKEEKLNRLQRRLDNESDAKFFGCEDKCIRLDFEQAMDFGFKCPECGKLINEVNNEDNLKSIRNQIENLKKDLKEGFKKK